MIHARDIIAVIVLLCLFFLQFKGHASDLMNVTIPLILGYYFSKRVPEEALWRSNSPKKKGGDKKNKKDSK